MSADHLTVLVALYSLNTTSYYVYQLSIKIRYMLLLSHPLSLL